MLCTLFYCISAADQHITIQIYITSTMHITIVVIMATTIMIIVNIIVVVITVIR